MVALAFTKVSNGISLKTNCIFVFKNVCVKKLASRTEKLPFNLACTFRRVFFMIGVKDVIMIRVRNVV